MPDKMSKEKIDLLRAYGAEVVVAPTDVPPESPRVLLPRRGPADRGDPGRVPAQPVREPRQPGDALPQHRAGDVAPERRSDHAPGRRRRAPAARSRHRALPQGAQPGDPGHRRRPRRLDLLGRRGPPLPGRGRRRGLLAADVRPDHRRPLRPRSATRTLPRPPASSPYRGPAGRRLLRHRAVRRADRRARARRPGRDGGGRAPRRRARLPLARSSTTPGCASTASWRRSGERTVGDVLLRQARRPARSRRS